MDQIQMQRAGELLLKFGPKSISMDDIARHLGISKKTIYQEFANKQEIIERVVRQNVQQFRADVEEARTNATNAVHEIALMLDTLVNITGLVKTGFSAEMHKYFPENWIAVERDWINLLKEGISANLNRGISEGLYRPDLDLAFTVELRLRQIQRTLNGDYFGGKFGSLKDVFRKLTEFYLQAICTEKGREKVTAYLSENF